MKKEKAKQLIEDSMEGIEKEKILSKRQLQYTRFFGTWWIVRLYSMGYTLTKTNTEVSK